LEPMGCFALGCHGIGACSSDWMPYQPRLAAARSRLASHARKQNTRKH
jgi:hypothetical protein